jgi:thiosulfate/3-mercaptopyruvate sulfurtransferase
MSETALLADIAARGYAHPDVLVTTEWVAQNLKNPNIRIVESNEDSLLYPAAHIPGAVQVDWALDLNDTIRRDYVDRPGFDKLMSKIGVTRNTTVVFYGDKNNWWACYAFWVFELFGFKNMRILDGGRVKWEMESRPMVTDSPKYPPSNYTAPARDDARIRAFRDEVLAHTRSGKPLVDVRSPDEYTGKKTHMAEYPQEGVLRGGHIPGAKSVPWARAANPDGTFKTADELRAIYEKEIGLKRDDDVIAYCRIGERSSHTWFVLTYLLGYGKVRNYDGSWTEWGNAVRLPIER